MASRARYVRGDTNPIVVKADASYPVEKGDLIYAYSSTGAGRPASALNAQGTQEKDQLGFAKNFIGVALEKNGLQSGETTFRQDAGYQSTFLVATTGEFEFDCPAQAFTPNQPVGVYSASGAGCEDQKVDSLKGSATLSAMIGLAHPGMAPLKAASSPDRVIVSIVGNRVAATAPASGTYTGTSGM